MLGCSHEDKHYLHKNKDVNTNMISTYFSSSLHLMHTKCNGQEWNTYYL